MTRCRFEGIDGASTAAAPARIALLASREAPLLGPFFSVMN
ncbi:hypothetical protein STXM2123_2647 [Streptomyces sp. F-3]|nr:hypothetical protein STXM2123_2647 [Streptomyces sp. F-3]